MDKSRLLVVEDQAIIALDLTSRLTQLGYQVVGVVASGAEAVQQAILLQPDLILMDIQLQGDLDGIQATEQIRAQADLPVIYLTAHSDERTLQRARLTEPYGYVLKPFEDRELHMALEIALYKHRMEKKLRENERWLAATLRSIGDAVIATDAAGQIRFLNPIAETLTGWTQAEAAGRESDKVFSIIREDTRAPIDNPVKRVLHEAVTIEPASHAILVSRDGNETPIQDSAAPIRDEQGHIAGAVLVFRDVTDPRRVEAELRWAERRYRGLFEEAPLMYIVTRDQAGTPTIAECNQAFLFTLEYSLADVLGRPLADFYAPESRAELLDGGYRRALEGDFLTEERVLLTRDGRTIRTMLTAVPETDVHGTVVGTRAMFVDITKRKQAEEALRARNLELAHLLAEAKQLTAAAQQASRLKDEILSNTSHELRTPLTAIMSVLDIVLSHLYSSEDEMRTFIRAARDAANKLLGLVNDLLDLARLEAGAGHIQREKVEVTLLLAEVHALVRGSAEQKGLALELQLPAEPIPICFTDPQHVRRVLLNLLNNAVKFTAHGRVTLTAGVLTDQAARADRQLQITIQDTGIGISAEVQARLFEPFVQADGSTTRRYGGTGLGLSISRRLAEALGGSLTLYSAGEGCGTTTTLTIPLDPGAD